jgi:hypothetical protein
MSSSADTADLLTAAAPAVARAANDDAAGALSHEQVPPPASGWDPYEVWARRVRDPRRAADPR